MNTKFELNDKQETELKVWKLAIKKKYGKYGTYTYCFSPVGMGTGIKVKSDLSDETLDLSHVEDW